MMKLSRKKGIITLIVLVVLFVVIMLWMNFKMFISFGAPNYNKIDIFLEENLGELSYVADELLNREYISVTIRRNNVFNDANSYTMKVQHKYLVYEMLPIPSDLVAPIKMLFEEGVQVIGCSQNSINFTVWSSMDESRGMIYSYTGEEPDSEQLIEVRRLSKNDWFYYVHNYEKAKERNPERFQ